MSIKRAGEDLACDDAKKQKQLGPENTKSDNSSDPSFEFITDTFVRITCDSTSRVVHKDIVCQCSPVFKRALNGPFKEGIDQDINVKASEQTLINFLNWLYFRKLPCVQTDEEGVKEEEQSVKACSKWVDRANFSLYVFADMYDVPTLRRRIQEEQHKELCTHTIRVYWYADLLLLTNNLPASDPLCRIAIEFYARRWDDSMDETENLEARDALPAWFWFAVAKIQAGFLARDEFSNQIPDLEHFFDSDIAAENSDSDSE